MLQDLCDAVQDRDSDNSEAVIVMEGLETASLWQLLHLNIKACDSRYKLKDRLTDCHSYPRRPRRSIKRRQSG